MGYKHSNETQYKKGDILYGNNSINIKIIEVYADGSVDIQLMADHQGYAYYNFTDPYRSNVRQENNNWLLMPADRILRNITMCTKVQFRFLYDTVQTKTCTRVSWWGNLYGRDMFYGNPPYGHYYIPGDVNQKVPRKDLPEADWREMFGLGSEWKRVPGSYRWHETGNVGYYGWRKENNYGPYLNRYAKRVAMEFTKGVRTEVQSGLINIDKIKVPIKTYIPEPIDAYVYRTALKSSASVSYDELTKNRNGEFIKIHPYPAYNYFSIPADDGNDVLNFAWTSSEDADESKNTYENVTVKFTDAYTGAVTNYTVNGNALTGELTNAVDKPYKLAGRYEFEVRACFDGVATQTTRQRFVIEVKDNGIPKKPVIKDVDTEHHIQYDMTKDITTLAHTPYWKEEKFHTYKATYDYYKYENDGYDCKLVESKVPFENGKKIFNADGQYHIQVVATYRNGRTAMTEAVFMIDCRHPKTPTIIINGDEYTGKFMLPETSKKTYLINAIASIKSGPFTRNIIDIYFKKMACEEFERVGKNTLPPGGLFNRLGTWKITVYSEKTEVTYPDGSTLKSEVSEVIFAVKKKYTHNINKTTYVINRDNQYEKASYKPVPIDQEGKTAGYKVEARIDFMESLIDSGNLDMRFILDKHGNKITNPDGTYKTSLDYTGFESTLSKMYRVDGDDWKYYLDKMILYKNCYIECKSVDDDGFESNITGVRVTTIDHSTIPKKLEIVTELGENNIVETGSRIIIGENN